jgi:hypothetical protein
MIALLKITLIRSHFATMVRTVTFAGGLCTRFSGVLE